ncbi:MAG: hypothetical protein IPN69_14715 [Acidobacteria bacterium]|nr:hypothetical protein [Acidobacteriota bacterium]
MAPRWSRASCRSRAGASSSPPFRDSSPRRASGGRPRRAVFFINGRFVRDRVIAGGLLEGFRSILPHGVYPVAFLFVEIPLEEVDVNVHPAKTEVRFRRSEAVKEVIAEAVRSSLASVGVAPQPREPSVVPIRDERPRPEQSRIEFHIPEAAERAEVEAMISAVEIDVAVESEPPGPSRDRQRRIIRISVVSPNRLRSESRIPTSRFSKPEIKVSGSKDPRCPARIRNYSPIPRSRPSRPLTSNRFRPRSSARSVSFTSFIIAVDDEGLLLVDQHVAHERILFDKFRRKEADRPAGSQNLLIPETFDLTPAQAAAFEIVSKELEECGFDVMRLSGRTVAIKAVPTDVAPKDARNLLAELLDTVDAEKRGGARDLA